MPSLSAVFFDIDDTLFSSTDFAQQARLSAVEAMIDAGLRVSFDEALATLNRVIDAFGSNHPRHYDLMLNRLGRETYAPANPAIIVARGIAAYHDTKFKTLKPFEDAEEVLQRLHDTPDVKLGVITAGLPVKQAEKLIRLGLNRYFDSSAVFITDQLGFGKRDPELYRRACKALDVSPERAMHLGDRAESDVDPAKEAGMIAVLVQRGGKYANIAGRRTPDHVITDLRQLLAILRQDYGFAF